MKHKQFTKTRTIALCLIGLSGPAAALDGPVFTGIGDLPGEVFSSRVYAVSGDGNTVVGWGRSDAGIEAIRWSWDTGIEGLALCLVTSILYLELLLLALASMTGIGQLDRGGKNDA